MTFSEYISSLNSRFNTGRLQEFSAVPGSLICYLVTAIQDFIKERVSVFQSKSGLSFISEKEPEGKVCYLNNPEVRADYKVTFASIDLLDYVYAVLHSPSYTGKYKDFARNEFDWIPYPKNSETFWKLVDLGGELRHVHLLESPKVGKLITEYPVSGTNRVDKIRFEIYDHEQVFQGEEYQDYLGAVHINANQFFADVPVSVWEFHFGEYLPAQQWLNDRKGRILSNGDIGHYQKIIVALAESIRLKNEVNTIELE